MVIETQLKNPYKILPLGYLTRLSRQLEKVSFSMPKLLKKEFIEQGTEDYKASLVEVGKEKVLYITIPYKGCTQCPRCLFCGVQEQSNKDLIIGKIFGEKVLAKVREFTDINSPDSIVLYNGGNILRPAEMFQETVLADIPEFVASCPTLQSYELEARADDIVQFVESLKTIQAHLKGKKLRIRLGIEFLDDELLKRHRKGINTEQIQQAVNLLNKLDIGWNGYALLGGLDMSREEARNIAVQSGKFMIDNNAYKVSVNGVFVTDRLDESFAERIYVPDYQDLIFVLNQLCAYREAKSSKTLFKVGFKEEDTKNVVRFPYASSAKEIKEISSKLREFNLSQNPKCLV